jgi:hypothetical protein
VQHVFGKKMALQKKFSNHGALQTSHRASNAPRMARCALF